MRQGRPDLSEEVGQLSQFWVSGHDRAIQLLAASPPTQLPAHGMEKLVKFRFRRSRTCRCRRRRVVMSLSAIIFFDDHVHTEVPVLADNPLRSTLT